MSAAALAVLATRFQVRAAMVAAPFATEGLLLKPRARPECPI